MERKFSIKSVTTALILSLTIFSCSDSKESSSQENGTEPICQSKVSLGQNSIELKDECSGDSFSFFPQVKIDEKWLPESNNCQKENNAISCKAGNKGIISLSVNNLISEIKFKAAEDLAVSALRFYGEGEISGAKQWLSNGYQSWSQSGIVNILSKDAAKEDFDTELRARGDAEVLRKGKPLSWWFSFTGDNEKMLFLGGTTANVFKNWIRIYSVDDKTISVSAVSGLIDEKKSLKKDEEVTSESWLLSLSSDANKTLRAFADKIEARRVKAPVPATAGWNSWYDLYDSVSEKDILANADELNSVFSGFYESEEKLFVVIDDGWQKNWGEWEANEKFPLGIDGIAEEIKKKGFRPGIWLAPFIVSEKSDIYKNNPDWFVKDAVYPHGKNGDMYVLDTSKEEVREHISAFIKKLISQGIELLKIDFLFAGTYEGARSKDITGMEAYHLGLKTIREAAGEDILITVVGAPGVPSFKYADSWRIGYDISLELLKPSWAFIMNQMRNIASRWHFCDRAILCDADPALLRELPENEVDAGAWVVATAGGALFLSDNLPALSEERKKRGIQKSYASQSISGKAFYPDKVFPENTPDFLSSAVDDTIRRMNSHIVPRTWLSPEGKKYFFNYSNEEIELEGNKIAPRSVQLAK